MKRKRYKKERKWIFYVGIFFFLLIAFYIFNNKKSTWRIETFFHDATTTILNILVPKVEVDYRRVLDSINQELERENQELKQLLELSPSNYEFIHADVVFRDDEWYTYLWINKGSKAGIQKDMAVVSNDSLLGKIVEVGALSSKVELIHGNMKISVDVNHAGETYHGMIIGYQDGNYVVEVSKNIEIVLEDTVSTNGLGGIYPDGIYIGKVIDISTDSLGLTRLLTVEGNGNLDKIRYVSVIKR